MRRSPRLRSLARNVRALAPRVEKHRHSLGWRRVLPTSCASCRTKIELQSQGQSGRKSAFGPRAFPAGRASAPPAAIRSYLQRVEERNQLVLLVCAQAPIVVDYEGRFASVPQDRLVASERFAVVHQSIARTNAPKRSCAHLVSGVRWSVLDDAISCADVMQQEIAIGMDHLVS